MKLVQLESLNLYTDYVKKSATVCRERERERVRKRERKRMLQTKNRKTSFAFKLTLRNLTIKSVLILQIS